jgi:signal peptidase II
LETFSEETPRTKLNRKLLLSVAVFVLCVLIDQVIKIYVKTHFWRGDMINLIGNWFKMYFIENNGMAFGLELGGRTGKFVLTGFRLAVSGFGMWYLWQNIKKMAPNGLLISIALILAGAIGNIIDSVFYGALFKSRNDYPGSWFEGHVVDMFYAPMIEGYLPKWFPLWGGEAFTFFSPIWNFADACITVGVAIILLGQKNFFPPAAKSGATAGSTNAASTESIVDSGIQSEETIS